MVNKIKPEDCFNELPSKVSKITLAVESGGQVEQDTERKIRKYEELVEYLHGKVASQDAELRAATERQGEALTELAA